MLGTRSWLLRTSVRVTKRNISTPSTLLSTLSATQPRFSLNSSDVYILQQPSQFYQSLLESIRQAKNRIFISSLYIGKDEVELLHTLHSSLSANPRLKLDLNLDLLRSTRPGDSTAVALLPLLHAFPDRVRVRLFRSPKLHGLLAKVVPRRFDEGWGTWHPKVYGVDDQVMISGANLNASYFTNRQDRYLQFRHPHLANYCWDFLDTCGNFSFHLHPCTRGPDSEYRLEWPIPSIEPHNIATHAQSALRSLQQKYINERPDSRETGDVEICPMIQSGPLGVREEEQCLSTLFDQYDNPATTIDLTTGYFGLYPPYQNRVIQSKSSWRLLAASPKANGFLGSRGVSGRIPEGYTLLEQRFWKRVTKAKREWQPKSCTGVELREWERESWTYHAKGLWVTPAAGALPSISVFGSTNLNSRSANLDTELSFLMETSSEALQKRLAAEVTELRECSQIVGEETWEVPSRIVRWSTKALVAVFSTML